MTTPAVLILLCLVLTAAVTDVRRRRIPNWLTAAGLIAAFTYNGVTGGVSGLRTALIGLLVAFGSYFALYCIRAMGAGDVKLMAAVGALVGVANWVPIFIATAFVGGVAALALTLYRGRLATTLWNVGYVVGELLRFRAPFIKREELDVNSRKALTLPHGVSIAAATILCLGAGWLR